MASGEYFRLQLGCNLYRNNEEHTQVHIWPYVAGNMGGNNPSFIRHGVYGFHFMHGGAHINRFHRATWLQRARCFR